MKYYICHHPPLVQRKQKLLNTLCMHIPENDIMWVTGFPPEQLQFPDVHRFVNKNEMSLWCKHITCFEDQVKNNYELITIFEDDITFDETFIRYEQAFLTEFREMGGDLMFIGECCDIKPANIVPGKHVYHEPGYTTRCTHCYVVTLKAAQTILSRGFANAITIDHFLNEVIQHYNLKSCYTYPSILQGGFKSTLK